jgi:plasmid stabilization system protein ParE
VFEAPAYDRWTIARERLEEYRRTGEAVSVDEFMAELDRQIELASSEQGLTTSILPCAEAQRDAVRLADFLAPGRPTAGSRARATILSAIQSLDRFSERGAPAGQPPHGLRSCSSPFGTPGMSSSTWSTPIKCSVLRIFHSLEER